MDKTAASWIPWPLGSAFFEGLTAILAKQAASLVWVTGVYLLMRKTINSDNRDVPQDQIMDLPKGDSS